MSPKSINMAKIRLVDWYDLVMSLTRPSIYKIKEGILSNNAVYALMHWYNKFAIVSILDMYLIRIQIGYWYNCTWRVSGKKKSFYYYLDIVWETGFENLGALRKWCMHWHLPLSRFYGVATYFISKIRKIYTLQYILNNMHLYWLETIYIMVKKKKKKIYIAFIPRYNLIKRKIQNFIS